MARILIIEDEEGIRNLYRELLSGLYDLEFAESGEEGIGKGGSGDYDLVIADLHLDGQTDYEWNGAELVLGLDLLNEGKKYIIVSDYLDDVKYQSALSAVPGVFAQISKPFDLKEMLETIKAALA